MQIDKLIIKNYKIFKDITIKMNNHINIFVGENDAGKTTILEALSIALTGKLNGSNVMAKLSPDIFNYYVRKQYRESLETGTPENPPTIEIEVYFCNLKNDDVTFKEYKGTNNSLHEDAYGVKIVIELNKEYATTYKELLKDKKISDIPVELYKLDFRSFAAPDYYLNATSKRVAYIDATKKDYGVALNRFISSSIAEYLSEEDRTNLRIAYRGNRKDFTQSTSVKNLNLKLKSEYEFKNKILTLNLRENEIDGWKNEMALSIDEIPFENYGFGTQNIIKSEIFLKQNSEVDIIIMEEPENNLSFTNMSRLISKFSENTNKQLFISTHSSFVANRLGLNNLHLIANHAQTAFTSLSDKTYQYFLKLPEYNTLRLLLANQIILVEGPADELIIQRAYIDVYGKQPIENGIDVMSVGGVAFKRYCELAKLIGKQITVVTDNDGDSAKLEYYYTEFKDIINLCYEANDDLHTLEPSVLFKNKDSFEDFKSIIYHGNDIKTKNLEEIKSFMINNKTEWAMRVFLSETRIDYPDYILKAIGVLIDEE